MRNYAAVQEHLHRAKLNAGLLNDNTHSEGLVRAIEEAQRLFHLAAKEYHNRQLDIDPERQ